MYHYQYQGLRCAGAGIIIVCASNHTQAEKELSRLVSDVNLYKLIKVIDPREGVVFDANQV